MGDRSDSVESAKLKKVPITTSHPFERPFVVDGATYVMVDIPVSEGVGDGRLEEVLDLWAMRVGGLLWVLDSEVTGWPLCEADEERAWGMIREGTARLGELGELGELG